MESAVAGKLLDELAAWRPPGGVVSACVAIDPADRGEGWRIELRHQLEGLDEAVAERVLQHFPENSPLPHGRTQLGFLEVGGSGREIWRGFQIDPARTAVVHADRAWLAPLVGILERGGPVGIAVVSLERVRTFEWTLGEIEELDGWELEITSLDWRERKAPGRNAAGGTGTSASGHDQYAERLDHNRERFLKQAGALVGSRHGDRGWRSLVVIGEADRPRLFAKGLSQISERVHEIPENLISASGAEIGARLDEELEHLNQSREEALMARLGEAIGSEVGAALGPEEVLAAAQEGRARHVLFDGEREWELVGGVSVDELMIEAALATAAEVTPVSGLAAAALAAHHGAAALLRY
jgi:hypothetical protein